MSDTIRINVQEALIARDALTRYALNFGDDDKYFRRLNEKVQNIVRRACVHDAIPPSKPRKRNPRSDKNLDLVVPRGSDAKYRQPHPNPRTNP